MTPDSTYSLQALPEDSAGAGSSSRVVANGQPLATVVPGTEIALQLRCATTTVLATTYDYFDGCEHWVVLLREGGKPVDQLRLPDTFGFLQNLEILGPAEIRFGFFGTHDSWRLRVDERGSWSPSPRAISGRPLRFWLAKRHLVARRTVGPPWLQPGAPAQA